MFRVFYIGDTVIVNSCDKKYLIYENYRGFVKSVSFSSSVFNGKRTDEPYVIISGINGYFDTSSLFSSRMILLEKK